VGAIRVVLADDHPVVRRALRLLLEHDPGFEVVGEAHDLTTVMHHMRGRPPHVLVIDLSMPGGSSMEAIRELRGRKPSTAIVVLTMEDSPVFAQQALEAGASAFVLKEFADADLPQAVRHAARGEPYISPQVAERLRALERSGSGPGREPRPAHMRSHAPASSA
jgi:two-component system, NarL family, response regulator NreC